MIYISALLLILLYCVALVMSPEWTVVWGIINTITYMAVMSGQSITTLEDVFASMVAWFIAPFAFVLGALG